MTTQQQKYPIDFRNYPTYPFKNHTFRNFEHVYNDLKKLFGNIKIDEHTSIKGEVLNQNPNRIIAKYNDLLMVVKKFIEKLNNDIETAAKRGKSGVQINEKANKILADLFKASRKSQVKCSGDKYVVPGLFTKVEWDNPQILAAETNSLIINNTLFSNIQNCFETLKTMMLAMITQALGENAYIKAQNKSQIDNLLLREFTPQTNYRQYGGLRKSIKKSKSKSKSRSISRKRTSKKNKMRR